MRALTVADGLPYRQLHGWGEDDWNETKWRDTDWCKTSWREIDWCKRETICRHYSSRDCYLIQNGLDKTHSQSEFGEQKLIHGGHDG